MLGLNVTRVRAKTGVGVGSGDSMELERAIRAHGNNIEREQGLLIGMALLALLQFPDWLLKTIGCVLFLARILYAHGIQQLVDGVPLDTGGREHADCWLPVTGDPSSRCCTESGPDPAPIRVRGIGSGRAAPCPN